MNDSSTDADDISRDFVRELFSRSNRIQVTDQGVTPENLNTLFNTDD